MIPVCAEPTPGGVRLRDASSGQILFGAKRWPSREAAEGFLREANTRSEVCRWSFTETDYMPPKPKRRKEKR